jgi:D-tyrosyl-tRNA(Tyr) deacylase
MRIVIQRVKQASITIDNSVFAEIQNGILILLGIEDSDTEDDIEWLCGKISRLRIFNDNNGVMNKSVVDTQGELLVVSQFTLHASTKKGNRPSYIRASKPDFAIPMYDKFVDRLQQISNLSVKTGKFGAMMDVALINDGPVTIIIDSKNKDF